MLFRLVDLSPAAFEVSKTLRVPKPTRVKPKFIVGAKNGLL